MSESDEHGSLLDKINEKIHEYKHSSSSSSSDSDDDKKSKKSKKKKKLFGRKHPLHHVLGGGKGTHELEMEKFENFCCHIYFLYRKKRNTKSFETWIDKINHLLFCVVYELLLFPYLLLICKACNRHG